MMSSDYRGYARGQTLGCRQMQELVGSMGIGVRAQNPGDYELGGGESFPQHRHERDTAPFAHIRRGLSEIIQRGLINHIGEPFALWRGIPSSGCLRSVETRAGSIRRICLQ